MKFSVRVTATPAEGLKRLVTEPTEIDVSNGPGTVKVIGVGTFGTRFPVTIDGVDGVPDPFVASFSGDLLTLTYDPTKVTGPEPVVADVTGDAH